MRWIQQQLSQKKALASNPKHDVPAAFLDTVHAWITENGEVLVVLRYLHGAGNRD